MNTSELIKAMFEEVLAVAKNDPLPFVSGPALAGALLAQLEDMWPTISDDSRVMMVSIAVALEYQGKEGVYAAAASPVPGSISTTWGNA